MYQRNASFLISLKWIRICALWILLSWTKIGLCQICEQALSTVEPLAKTSIETQVVMDFLNASIDKQAEVKLKKIWKTIQMKLQQVKEKMSSQELRDYLEELLQMRTASSQTLSGSHVSPREQTIALK